MEAAFKMLGSECVDNCSAGCNLIMRFCDSRAIWPPFLQPSPQRVQQIHAALFAVQGAHRDVLPAINRLFQKKGWVDAFVQNPDFEVFAAFLASEIELPGSDAASELTESRPHSHPDGIHRTSDRDVSANPRQSVHSDVSAEGYEVEQLMSNTSEDSDNMSSIGDHVSDDETSAFQVIALCCQKKSCSHVSMVLICLPYMCNAGPRREELCLELGCWDHGYACSWKFAGGDHVCQASRLSQHC